MADLQDACDASVLENTITTHACSMLNVHSPQLFLIVSSLSVLYEMCQQLILSLLNMVTDDSVTVTVAEMNIAYLSILKRYHM